MGKWYCPPGKEVGSEIYNWMSRSLAKSRKAIATKSLKEKWLNMVQSAREKGENGTGGSSTITPYSRLGWIVWLRTCATLLNEDWGSLQVRPWSWPRSCQGCTPVLFYLHPHSLHYLWGRPGSRYSEQGWLHHRQLSQRWHVSPPQGCYKLWLMKWSLATWHEADIVGVQLWLAAQWTMFKSHQHAIIQITLSLGNKSDGAIIIKYNKYH